MYGVVQIPIVHQIIGKLAKFIEPIFNVTEKIALQVATALVKSIFQQFATTGLAIASGAPIGQAFKQLAIGIGKTQILTTALKL